MRVTADMANAWMVAFFFTLSLAVAGGVYLGYAEVLRIKKQRVCVKHHVKKLKWDVDKSIRYCRNAS